MMGIIARFSLVVGCMHLFATLTSAQISDTNARRITNQGVIVSEDIATPYTPKPVQTVAGVACDGECDWCLVWL